MEIRRKNPEDFIVAIAGNPNVGKSTIFNQLTGMNQHTGNWPGKTVANVQGYCQTEKGSYVMVDIPGTYSLMAHSAEEEVARDFLCFGNADAVIVVCDATCLERNLNLVLQTREITKKVIVCVNLMDEAKRKKIHIQLQRLSDLLGVPVVGTVARKRKTTNVLLDTMDDFIRKEVSGDYEKIIYDEPIEEAVFELESTLAQMVGSRFNPRWLSLKLLEGDKAFISQIYSGISLDSEKREKLEDCIQRARNRLSEQGIGEEEWKDKIVSGLVRKAEEICRQVVSFEKREYNAVDRKIDRILTSKVTGYPVMLLLLALIFWITINGANYPSQILSDLFFQGQKYLDVLFEMAGAPEWLHGVVVLGIYRVLAWVISVMLPPMAIFFPLFTLLEDAGYLPRIAYNLDKPFKRCQACGKQALTMCMGFGCNAAGIVGCRIIDSPRERLIAMITNNFVPCNGRFPTLIAIISMFFVADMGLTGGSFISVLILTGVILFGIAMTFFISKLLSKTILKGVPSSFTLELPPYRRPQVGRVIFRSIFDRTLFVLGRAILIAAPAGLIIWCMANITIGEISLLSYLAGFLDPFARLLGLDGVILLAFILGLPANEIVVPIIIMAYMSQGSLIELESLAEMKQLFISHGWTWVTAVCTMLFSLMHWPCSTSLLTIKKETGSWKWVGISFLVPTLTGMAVCFLVSALAKLF